MPKNVVKHPTVSMIILLCANVVVMMIPHPVNIKNGWQYWWYQSCVSMIERKVAIVGSRNFPDLDIVRSTIRNLVNESVCLDQTITIVSGGARGPDKAGENEAKRLRLKTIIFLADWDQYGKAAGFIRNTQIANECDEVIAFWDGKSNGTRNTIAKAKKFGKKITVVTPDGKREIYETKE